MCVQSLAGGRRVPVGDREMKIAQHWQATVTYMAYRPHKRRVIEKAHETRPMATGHSFWAALRVARVGVYVPVSSLIEVALCSPCPTACLGTPGFEMVLCLILILKMNHIWRASYRTSGTDCASVRVARPWQYAAQHSTVPGERWS